MALTQTQVSELYASIFGRASEGEGNTFWQAQADVATAATNMLATTAAAAYFGSSLDSDQAFIEHIYLNTLGKTYAEDTSGVDFWVTALATHDRGYVVSQLIEAINNSANDGSAAQNQFNNRVAVSNYTADTLSTAPSDYATSLAFGGNLTVTDDAATVTSAEANVAALTSTVTLTNGTDIKTAGTFDAPMVYTPNGNDRILSLQDEDQLTGLGDLATLNATLGNRNANEGTTAVVTPVLKNITNLNIDWTGNTNVLDLRYADSIKTINIDKVTSDAGVVTVQNITTKASDLSVSNVHDNASSVIFDYVRDVLSGNADEATMALDNVLANSLIVQTDGGALNEGYETVNLSVKDGVDLRGAFSVAQMENLVVKGEGRLNIDNLVWTANEFNAFTAAIANPGSIGQRTIDLSGFSGPSDIDISLNLGKQVDPGNSGKAFYGVTTGGSGDDTFRTNVAVAGNDAVDHAHNIIDGGAGNNTLVSYNGNIANDAEINNVQTLELRDQDGAAGFGTVDMDAFDSTLASIVMRNEDGAAAYAAAYATAIGVPGTTVAAATAAATAASAAAAATATAFTLNDMTATQAENMMTLHHGITGSSLNTQTVVANLKDASGTDDTVGLTVVNDLNTGPTFNYTLTAGGTTAATTVENITLHDNDTESNTVTLTNNAVHTGTLKIDGGTAGTSYTLANTIDSAVVDASTDASDLRLTVGDIAAATPITQDVKLGTGDDVLTFANVDELDSTDSLTDAGGVDTVRAAFSKDSNLSINGIENLQVIANANVKLGMGSANISNLVLLADSAAAGQRGGAITDVDNNGSVDMNIVAYPTAVQTANIVTLDHSALTELNFFGDADLNNTSTAAADETVTHNFNGVTLTNNTANNITVNINTSLDLNNTGAAAGALAYNIGQITSHGNTGMDIQVGNERINSGTTTTINNIYAKTMDTLTATATGNLNLGTVSGAPLNNSLTTFDMSAVGGNVGTTVANTVHIISLGDNAVVTLANGNNHVSALGSAGKDVTMTAGNGNNTLTGTAQDDTITTGSGWDTIAGDRGDNVIDSGAGNDTVTAKDGSDTVDLGTGIDSYIDNAGTGILANTATNTVSMSGGVAAIRLDTAGDDTAGADGILGTADDVIVGIDVDQMLAVGNGSDLTVSWLGGTMNAATAVLDGALSIVTAGSAATTATANADLNIITTGGVSTVAASAGNDVTIFTGSVAGTDGLTFNGGAGNDAAVGTASVDNFTGGTGADKFVMQDTSTIDGNSDRVIIADGDSMASAYDTVFGWDVGSAAAVAAAVVGAATAGSDVLDLDSTTIAGPVAATTLTSSFQASNGASIEGYTIGGTGLVTFQNLGADHAVGGIGANADATVQVGTGTGEISLSNALTALATELNGTGATAIFTYDANGVGGITAADSTFVFQDGVNDTVVELAGVFTATGLENVAGAADTLINIA